MCRRCRGGRGRRGGFGMRFLGGSEMGGWWGVGGGWVGRDVEFLWIIKEWGRGE